MCTLRINDCGILEALTEGRPEAPKPKRAPARWAVVGQLRADLPQGAGRYCVQRERTATVWRVRFVRTHELLPPRSKPVSHQGEGESPARRSVRRGSTGILGPQMDLKQMT